MAGPRVPLTSLVIARALEGIGDQKAPTTDRVSVRPSAATREAEAALRWRTLLRTEEP